GSRHNAPRTRRRGRPFKADPSLRWYQFFGWLGRYLALLPEQCTESDQQGAKESHGVERSTRAGQSLTRSTRRRRRRGCRRVEARRQRGQRRDRAVQRTVDALADRNCRLVADGRGVTGNGIRRAAGRVVGRRVVECETAEAAETLTIEGQVGGVVAGGH